MGIAEARRQGLVDRVLPAAPRAIAGLARQLAEDPALDARLADKRRCRHAHEAVNPLGAYRDEELARSRRNLRLCPSNRVARYNFIHKAPKSRNRLTLAGHRGALAKPPRTPHSL